MLQRAVVAVLLLLLGGCVRPQPLPHPGCALTAYPLRVDGARLAAAPDFESIIRASMSAPARAGALAGERPSVLVLSGGSQHGAFGAGFFAGLPAIPEFKLVTGVSTGALQSTFLFLANQPVPTDRVYPAYFRMAPGTPHSNAGDVALAYSIAHESDLLHVGRGGQVGGVIRGSIGDFAPLRAVLAGLLSPDTLREVGRAYRPDPREGRRLLVGVVDANDGAGYAIDLTELAARFAAGRQDYAATRACYVDALIASSSVPIAVPPVTLETQGAGGATRHMYIDGGARFGVFWSQLGAILAGGLAPEATLIVNGSLYGRPWLDGNGAPRTSWSALTLGFRAVDILENQVYRFSVENVNQVAAGAGRVRMAFISGDGLPPSWGDPDTHPYQGKTCAEWTAEDDRLEKPTEFHPRYMRCLVDYGHARGAAEAWNRDR